ncbi:unnamed protein product [Pseudo-nitzschia multistriata]|uniref:Uncharacterized protein n=1 Tax=Pseudo-nitzschia multistriata TaxID=183589 RepID=A0A448ZHQ1_9STRA|nr:unnamed protein product [Pseudo-nitzschia multistriata]
MSNARHPSGAAVPSLPLTQTNPLYQAAYTALERKKFLPLVKKKQHLSAIQKITEGDVQALFPGNQAKGLRQEMCLLHTDIVSAGLGKSKQEKAWRSHYASSILASVYVGMEMRKGVELPSPSIHQRASRSRSSNDATRALPLFRSAAKAVKEAVGKQEDEVIEKQNKGSSIKQQRDGKRKQDKIPFDPSKAEAFACPKCGGKGDVKPVVVKSEFKLPGPLPKRRKNKGSAVAATPSFARKIRQESVKQSFGNNTPSIVDALDLLSRQLTAEDTSTEAMALKKRAQDMENICPNVEEATGSLVKFAKRQLFAKQQEKQACPAPSNTGGLNLLSAAASTAAGLKRPAAGWGLGLGLGLKRITKRPAAKKALAVPSKKASPGGLPSSQSSGGFDCGDSD